jgi:putative ABC transport system substrate-binding protein
MSTRRDFITLLGGAAAGWPVPVRAQSLHRIGFLGDGSPAAIANWVERFRAGLRSLGYIEGRNITIEFQWTDGERGRLADAAAELVRRRVDVIVTWGTPGTRAAKEATGNIPIVMAISGDAVATGLIASLANPRGNITGTTQFNPEICAKRLELIKEALPRTTRVAVFLNPDNPISQKNFQAAANTAASINVDLRLFESRRATDFEGAFAAISRNSVDAITMFEDPMLMANAKPIVDAALAQRLPVIGHLELAEAGGLIAYGVSFPEIFYRAAIFVDKIIKGAKPSEIPVERPDKFRLVLNNKAARVLAIGEFPHTLLSRADEVIE